MITRIIFIASLLYTTLASGQGIDTAQQITPGRQNSTEQQKKPYVIMISVDGMRWDYAKKYKAQHLLALAREGASAASMVPSYPSVTFPNHYSLVTGLYPSHHGIVGNKFYDRKFKENYNTKGKTVVDGRWYGGVPLWVLAEQQKMLTASFYWVGSEAPINGVLPTYYYKYNEKISIEQRIQAVVNWLKLPAKARPHLITFYFPEVDHAGHHFGPDSEEARKAVTFIDSAVNKLNNAVKATKLPVSFILVADHGMTNVYTDKALTIPVLDTAKFNIQSEGEIAHIYAKDTSLVISTYARLKKEAVNYRVFLSTNTPATWNYNKANDRFDRIADILLIPDQHYVFAPAGRKVNPGAHGYDPYIVKDMHATFFAWGPAFKTGTAIPSFKNVEIYPVVTKILRLKPAGAIDGKGVVAKQILK